MALKFNRNFNISRVVRKIVYTVLALYVGGTIISVFGGVMNCTHSPFYDGLSLIGWTVTDSVNVGGNTVACNTSGLTAGTYNNVITAVSGTGVLAVIGVIGIAGVVMEFISWG